MKITLLDKMGTDLTVVNAARVPFAKHHDVFDGERDEELIAYLAENGHWTPFAHPQVSLHVKVPFFVANQLKRHTVGLVVNEVSRRYVDDAPEFYMPEAFRKTVSDKKQGSGETFENGLNESLRASVEYQQGRDAFVYRLLINSGVCPEQARMVLPQSTYTEWQWTGSLAAFARVVTQRSHPHAQAEVREVAAQLRDILYDAFPISCKYLLP